MFFNEVIASPAVAGLGNLIPIITQFIESCGLQWRKYMKVDLSVRDIELILNLLNNAIDEDFVICEDASFTSAEVALISKLESALRAQAFSQKVAFDTGTSDTFH